MSDVNKLLNDASELANQAAKVSDKAVTLAETIANTTMPVKEVIVNNQATIVDGVDPFIFALTVFVLACFVGYYVVWKVTPALHTPLMSVTNAVSSIIVVGAILAVGGVSFAVAETIGTIAIFIASVNIFGGFIVTQRMLHMFKKKG